MAGETLVNGLDGGDVQGPNPGEVTGRPLLAGVIGSLALSSAGKPHKHTGESASGRETTTAEGKPVDDSGITDIDQLMFTEDGIVKTGADGVQEPSYGAEYLA